MPEAKSEGRSEKAEQAAEFKVQSANIKMQSGTEVVEWSSGLVVE
jgi:hypothetical protein